MKLNALLLTLAIIFTTNTHAAGNTPPGGKIFVLSIGKIILVSLIDDAGKRISSNVASCTGDSDIDTSTFVLVRDDNVDFEESFAGLLLAKGSNASVRLWLNDCHTMTRADGTTVIRSVIGGVNLT